MDCLDCKHCRIRSKEKILICKAGHWQLDNLTEKSIILGQLEIETLHIKPRKLFLMGRKCEDMVNMNG